MILGIDSSIANCGWCVMGIASGQVMGSGVFRTSTKDTIGNRQASLKKQLKGVLGDKQYALRLAIIEIPAGIPYNRTQGRGGRIINLPGLLLLSRAIGVLTLTLHDWGIKIEEVTPAIWKGNRQKCWDQLSAERLLGRKVTSNDESDAIGLADFGRRIFGRAMV